MTPKQKLFIEEYLVDLNATQAAIRAGYSPKTAYRIGAELLQKTSVSAGIQEALAERERRTEVTADMVIRELARIAFADIRTLYREDGSMKLPHELDDDAAATLAGVDTYEETSGGAVTGYTRKSRRWDKAKALELLGKHLGMFPVNGKVELSLGVGDAPDAEGRRVARRLILEEVRESREPGENGGSSPVA